MKPLRSYLALSVSLIVLLVASGAASALGQTDLDPSFGINGIAVPADSVGDHPTIAAQSDGKFVVAFTTVAGQPTVMRLNSNGSVDGGFAVSGKIVLSSMGGSNPEIRRVLVDSAGKIWIAGSVLSNPFRYAVIWSLNPDGGLNATFDGDGEKLLSQVGMGDNRAVDAALTPSNGIALANEMLGTPWKAISLRSFSPAGVAEATATRSFGDADLNPTSIAVQPSGRIIVGATSLSATASGLLFGHTSTGSSDPTFGAPGGDFAFFGPSTAVGQTSRLFTAGDQLAAVGSVGSASAMAVYSHDGIPNPGIATSNASLLTPPGATSATGTDGAAAAGGKVVTVGLASTAGGTPPYITRHNPDGSPDEAFAPSGVAFLPVPSGRRPAIARQPDGKYVIVSADNGGKLHIGRIWGDVPAPQPQPEPLPQPQIQPLPQPAKAAFASSVKKKNKATKARRFSGTATGTGVSKVELAIQKVDSKLLKKSKKCSYVRSTKGSLKKVKAVKGKCVPSVWIKARGTDRWSVKLSKALKPGNYVLSARATGVLGVGRVVKKSITLTK